MAFYHIGHNSFRSRKWTWGWSVKPWPNKMGVTCDVCGRGHLYPGRYPERPLDVEVEGRSEYPDLLGCASSELIVSEAVIGDWETNDVRGYEKYPITVTKATGRAIQQKVPPQYFHIKVTGRCELDLDACGIRIVYLCPKCGYQKHELIHDDPDENPFECFPFVFREETWDGSDLFVSDLFDCVHFCSEKVFDLAGLNQRTNFRFERPEDRGMDGDRAIDYMAAGRAQRRAMRRPGDVPPPKPAKAASKTDSTEGGKGSSGDPVQGVLEL